MAVFPTENKSRGGVKACLDVAVAPDGSELDNDLRQYRYPLVGQGMVLPIPSSQSGCSMSPPGSPTNRKRSSWSGALRWVPMIIGP